MPTHEIVKRNETKSLTYEKYVNTIYGLLLSAPMYGYSKYNKFTLLITDNLVLLVKLLNHDIKINIRYD